MHRIWIASLILVVYVLKLGECSGDIHIVYTERPQNEEPKVFHLRTLSNLLGSDAAAKNSLIYSYSSVMCGFAAKLTPGQVQRLSRQPGILQVVPSQRYQLHGGSGNSVNSRHGNSLFSGRKIRY